MEIKNLQKTAKELNKILFAEGDEQAINLDAKEKTLVAEIKEAAELLTPDDKLSTGTQKVLAELGITIGGTGSDEAEIEDVDDIDDETEVDPDDEPEMPEPKKMTTTRGGKVETPPTPQELIKKAKGREALVDLLNTYTDLKPLRTVHRNYKKDEDLRQVMIALLNGEITAKEIQGVAEEVEKKSTPTEKKEPAVNQTEIIRMMIVKKEPKEKIIEHLSKQTNKSTAWASNRLKLYEKFYGVNGINDLKIMK